MAPKKMEYLAYGVVVTVGVVVLGVSINKTNEAMNAAVNGLGLEDTEVSRHWVNPPMSVCSGKNHVAFDWKGEGADGTVNGTGCCRTMFWGLYVAACTTELTLPPSDGPSGR